MCEAGTCASAATRKKLETHRVKRVRLLPHVGVAATRDRLQLGAGHTLHDRVREAGRDQDVVLGHAHQRRTANVGEALEGVMTAHGLALAVKSDERLRMRVREGV